MIGFAHRGGCGEAPENTLAAFEHALAVGVNGLESDVWVTADGVVVLHHDGVVGRRPLPQLRRAELPPQLPTLAELFLRCGRDFHLSLDLRDPNPRTAELVMAVVAEHGDLSRLYLCGAAQRARAWRAIDDRVHPVASVPGTYRRAKFAEHARWLASAGVCAVNMRARSWSRERLAAVHEPGLLAFARGAKSRWQLLRTRWLGCDAVYGDHPKRLVAVLGRNAPR